MQGDTSFWDDLVAAHYEVMDALHINMTDIWSQPGMMSGLREFSDAVDWTEPFFFFVFLGHVVVAGMVLELLRKGDPNRLFALFVLLALAVLGAERVNQWGHTHHAQLFRDPQTDYFDDSGIFIAAILSGPLMVWAFVIQVRLLIIVFQQLLAVKRRELRAKQPQPKSPVSPVAKGPAKPPSSPTSSNKQQPKTDKRKNTKS